MPPPTANDFRVYPPWLKSWSRAWDQNQQSCRFGRKWNYLWSVNALGNPRRSIDLSVDIPITISLPWFSTGGNFLQISQLLLGLQWGKGNSFVWQVRGLFTKCLCEFNKAVSPNLFAFSKHHLNDFGQVTGGQTLNLGFQLLYFRGWSGPTNFLKVSIFFFFYLFIYLIVKLPQVRNHRYIILATLFWSSLHAVWTLPIGNNATTGAILSKQLLQGAPHLVWTFIVQGLWGQAAWCRATNKKARFTNLNWTVFLYSGGDFPANCFSLLKWCTWVMKDCKFQQQAPVGQAQHPMDNGLWPFLTPEQKYSTTSQAETSIHNSILVLSGSIPWSAHKILIKHILTWKADLTSLLCTNNLCFPPPVAVFFVNIPTFPLSSSDSQNISNFSQNYVFVFFPFLPIKLSWGNYSIRHFSFFPFSASLISFRLCLFFFLLFHFSFPSVKITFPSKEICDSFSKLSFTLSFLV